MAETGCSFIEGIPPALATQIHKREEKFGKSPKTVEELETINGNCPWVLLRSGVDAPVHDNERFIVVPSGSTMPATTPDWAKKTVFGGELQYRTGSVIYPATGVEGVHKNEEGKNPYMYYLTTDFGHRAIGGITEVHVVSKDTWGMIMEAEIKLKVWSKNDLENLDRVYFKPGYTVLLEWGHTLFFDNEGKSRKAAGPIISSERFWKGGSYTELDQDILDAKENTNDYNYANREALFGYVTNFSFSFNKDGSYDCTLKMLSKGSVIAGLKIKGIDNYRGKIDDDSDPDDKAVNYEDISVWHRIYWAFTVGGMAYKAFGTHYIDPGSIEEIEGRDLSLKNIWRLPNRDKVVPRPAVLNGEGLIRRLTVPLGSDKFLFNNESCKELDSFPVYYVPYLLKSHWWQLFKADQTVLWEPYITLRSLLHLINVFNTERGRFQFNCWEKAPYVDVCHKPFDEDEWPIPSVSLNPLIALKPNQSRLDDGLYRLDYLASEPDSLADYVAGESREKNDDSDYKKILNIWIDFGRFVNVVHEGLKNDKDYTILQALQDFLQQVQTAFGNINEFKVVADHKWGGTVFSIIDTKNLRAPESIEKLPERINVTGLKNTVSNLEIKSEISSEMANMMCIAAQRPASNSENASGTDEAVVRWGENCKQRWGLPDDRQPGDLVEDHEAEEREEDIRKKRKKFVKKLRKLYKKVRELFTVSTSSGPEGAGLPGMMASVSDDMFSDVLLDGETYMHQRVTEELKDPPENTGNLQMGVVPIRAGLTMLGIGNLKIGNVFRLGTNVLLSKYENWGHIITGLEHRIDKSGWKTTLKTQYYPVSSSSAVPLSPAGSVRPSSTLSSTSPSTAPAISDESSIAIVFTSAHSSRQKREEWSWSKDFCGHIVNYLSTESPSREFWNGKVTYAMTNTGYSLMHSSCYDPGTKNVAHWIREKGEHNVISIVPHWNGTAGGEGQGYVSFHYRNGDAGLDRHGERHDHYGGISDGSIKLYDCFMEAARDGIEKFKELVDRGEIQPYPTSPRGVRPAYGGKNIWVKAVGKGRDGGGDPAVPWKRDTDPSPAPGHSYFPTCPCILCENFFGDAGGPGWGRDVPNTGAWWLSQREVMQWMSEWYEQALIKYLDSAGITVPVSNSSSGTSYTSYTPPPSLALPTS